MRGADEFASRSELIELVRRVGLSWPMLLGGCAFLVVLGMGAARIGPDTYWQIATGRWILTHGYVPTHDIFSFTRHGVRWIAQEWGAEVLVAVVYAMASWPGLAMLAALSFALTIAYLTNFLISRMEPLHAVVLAVSAGCIMFNHIFVRPHVLVWPLTALWVGVLIDSSEKNRAPPWWLLGVMLLWANLHASFVLGLGLGVAIAIEAVLNAKEYWKRTAQRWVAFIAAASGCALLNPQGWRLLVFPFHLLGMHVLGRLTEWKPPNLQHPQVFGLWLLALVGLSFAGRVRLPLVRVALLIGLIFFALQHERNVSLLGMITPFLIAGPLAALWRKESNPRHDTQALDRIFRALGGPGGSRALLATVVLVGALGVGLVRLRIPRPLAQSTPRAALDALLTRRPSARILNDAEFGGYLIFRGVPVFVDPRMSVYGDAFLRRYFDALELKRKGDINALVKKYRINAILLLRGWSVAGLLDRSREWKRVYAGKWAVAYLHRNVPKS